MVAYTTRMPAGFPGRISREDSLTVETHVIDSNSPPTVYGQPAKLVSGKLQAAGADADVYGLLVAPYPTQSATTGLGAATPPTSGLADVLRRGYMTVAVARGTAVAGPAGTVSYRTTTNGGALAGQYEGDDTNVGKGDSDCIELTKATWMGPADANGIAELAFNI